MNKYFGLICLFPVLACAQESITFTNKGELVKDAEVIRAERNRLIYRTPNGGGAVKLKDLPKDLQERFHYDSVLAEAQDEKEQKARASERAATFEHAAIKHEGIASLGSDPVRFLNGRRYDFTEAINWLRSKPPLGSPNDSVAANWEAHRTMHQRYLVDGMIREHRTEGFVIDVPTTRTYESGGVRNGRSIYPTYTTVNTTKEVLLRNVPGDLKLPVFAIPIGTAALGTTVVEAFDYGAPDPAVASMVRPGEGRVDFRRFSAGIPHDVFEQIKEDAAHSWPRDFEMQEYVIRNQTEAYRKLHNEFGR